MADRDLKARRVLIAEDEILIALDLAEAFENAGAEVLGPVSSLERAFSFLETEERIDLVGLDLNLGGELAYPLAAELAQRDVPFLFSTGYDGAEISPSFEDVIRLTKPASGEEAVEQARRIFKAEPETQ